MTLLLNLDRDTKCLRLLLYVHPSHTHTHSVHISQLHIRYRYVCVQAHDNVIQRTLPRSLSV